jgi:LemA protein
MAKEDITKPIFMKPWFIALVIVVMAGLWVMFTYNGLVVQQQAVDAQWAQVQTQYQRRFDLIPNLVATLNKYQRFEAGLLTNITSLRSQWASTANVDQKVGVATQLDSALSRLLVVYENYPELHTIDAVSSLMDELSGTENRISVERMRFNTAVQGYNTAVRTFPTVVIANLFGFSERAYFQSVPLAEVPPQVS